MQPNDQQQYEITYSSGVPDMPMNKLSNWLMVSFHKALVYVPTNQYVERQVLSHCSAGMSLFVAHTAVQQVAVSTSLKANAFHSVTFV